MRNFLASKVLDMVTGSNQKVSLREAYHTGEAYQSALQGRNFFQLRHSYVPRSPPPLSRMTPWRHAKTPYPAHQRCHGAAGCKGEVGGGLGHRLQSISRTTAGGGGGGAEGLWGVMCETHMPPYLACTHTVHTNT